MNELPLFGPEPQPAPGGPVTHYDIHLTTTIPITAPADWTEEKVRETVEAFLVEGLDSAPGIEVTDSAGFEIYPDEDATVATSEIPDSPAGLEESG